MPWNEIEAALDDLLSSFFAASTAFIVTGGRRRGGMDPDAFHAPTRTRTS